MKKSILVLVFLMIFNMIVPVQGISMPQSNSQDNMGTQMLENNFSLPITPSAITSELDTYMEPNDTYYNSQWAIDAIQSDLVWEFRDDLRIHDDEVEVVVAVIDTGVDYTHEDLVNRMKMNGDNVKGYNAITKQESHFMDDSDDSHGTMVAGVIAAETGNGKGIAGVAGYFNVKIMPIKALDENGNANIDDVADAIIWATNNGANVINISSGDWFTYDSFPTELSDAIDYACNKEALVVAAAGNDGEDIKQDAKAYYPACLPNVLSVGSVSLDDSDLQYSEFTNTGAKIYAPGENIYSTIIGDEYGEDDGTSLAAAHVSGAAALLSYAMKADQYIEDNYSTLFNSLVISLSQDSGILNVLIANNFLLSPISFFNATILTPEQDANVSGNINITTQIIGYYNLVKEYDLGYFKLQYKLKEAPDEDESYIDIQSIQINKGNFSKYSGDWDTTQIANGEYTVRAMYYENNDSLITADFLPPPMVDIIIANSGLVPEIATIRLNAPRKNINGSLYMEDTVGIELISTETNLSQPPNVTVSYDEWNNERDTVVNKTKTITLIETAPGSKRYSTDFPLTEGICKITTLTGELTSDISKMVNINLHVAGRLKAIIQQPDGLDANQIEIYNDLLSDSFVMVKSEAGNDVITSNSIDSDVFTLEGLEEARDYVLTHYDMNNLMIFQKSIDAHVKYGLETVFPYELNRLPSNIKVKVVDDVTGLPIENVMVTSKLLTFLSSEKFAASTKTGKDGYAATVGEYFSKNILMGSDIELSTKFLSVSSNIDDWYENKTIKLDSLAIGDNEIEIRLTKPKIVTLQGTVTDNKGVPIKGVYVTMPHIIKNKVINPVSITDVYGRYSMQVSSVETEVSFSINEDITKKSVSLTEDINTLDVTIIPLIHSTVNVILETMDENGLIDRMEVDQAANSLMHLSVKNNSNGIIGSLSRYYPSVYTLKGNAGDIIQITADGGGGYGKGTATAVLDHNNHAEIKLVLKKLGSVNVNVTDQSGDEKLGKFRYMYIYSADNGYYVTSNDSLNSYISCVLPDGEYKAVISWEYKSLQLLSSWEDYPNCIISNSFIIENGESVSLGTKELIYYEDSYFSNNKENTFEASNNIALPGAVITLRAAYDYDYNNTTPIDSGKLDLVVQIPLGTTLVTNTVYNRVTRGNIGEKQPVISDNSIVLDLKDGIERGISGVLIYQVKVDNPLIYENIMANAEMKYIAGIPRSETIGNVIIPTNLITLNAPSEIAKASIGKVVTLNGLAPENSTIELFDGNIKIGEAITKASGVWDAYVTLPDRGTPIYHFITAKVMIDGMEYSDTAEILVGLDKVVMTNFTLEQGLRMFSFDPRDGYIYFPFVKMSEDFIATATFSDGDRVENVKIDGYDTVRQGDKFSARIPVDMLRLLNVQYDEPKVEDEKILKFDHGQPPSFIEDAETELVNGTAGDIKLEYGVDGYIKSFSMPEIKLTALDETVVASMKIETVNFDTAKAKNRTDLGDGMYGYNFSYELVDGKYVISAYVDRRLIEKPAGFQGNKQTTIRAAAKSALEVAKITIEVASDANTLMNAYGDLSKAGKMMNLTRKFNECGSNSFNSDYYAKQIDLMNRDILVSKSLGLASNVVAKAGKFVPLLGKVVVELSELVAGKLLDDMFDSEFDSDYGRLMSMLNNESCNRKDDIEHKKREDYGDYWRNRDRVANVVWIMDPSGFVYEAVEDNTIEGVVTTVLFLEKDEATDAVAAKASDKWQFWDAEWYLQENPQLTGVDGKYAWDVPEGWWMVQCVKDGYITAYSDALPVPPPQFDINIPMVSLKQPAVEKTVWGNGGRYIDIYFNKYMNVESFEKANAINVVDMDGNNITGSAISAIPQKTGVNGLKLTKVVRFNPEEELTEGEIYTLTVNKFVFDYADFTMAKDYTETDNVPASAPIASLIGFDFTVEPGMDITQSIYEALKFTADDPNDQNMMDKRVIFSSSNNKVVMFMEDGRAVSVGEGTAEITIKSIDDARKTAVFNITVAYPPRDINVNRMAIKDEGENLLLDLSITQGEKYTLNPIISPDNATNKNILYTSDNTSVATVNKLGVIEAISESIATITAKTEDQGIRQKILITVKPKEGSDGSKGGSKTPIVEKPIDVFKFKFTDVKETDWFYEAVRFLAEKGIAKGISETEYAPSKTVTRAEFITMLCRTYGIEERSGENFADAGNNWYTGFLVAAKQLGIAQGVGNNMFQPDREITREEMVVMLYNYFRSISETEATDIKNALSYNDKDKISSWAMEAVIYASASGWIKGKGNNNLDPQGIATRAELAQIFYNLIGDIKKSIL